MGRFYKSNINKRILFGDNNKAIELVGPDGGAPNFQYIQWNLTNYTEVKDFSINLPHSKKIQKDEQFVNIIKNKNNVYMFLHSPINNVRAATVVNNTRIVPYILKNNINGKENKSALGSCTWDEFKAFFNFPPAGYKIGSEDRIIIKGSGSDE
ncbi:MAG: hypothetical protein SLAVMIC_00646 [uncultured marine phage]|uniref:Uncharacterized protein n=1 Tax=uncultured marine phage TaxID=707152 RepID=A0A8D9FSB5_9VIRU|nr:MAG: hypothetical protein SLAVMIC_00646 [uncultured marine phage]